MTTESTPQPEQSFPEPLSEAGITSLVAVIPPDAPLAPRNTIPPSQRGDFAEAFFQNGYTDLIPVIPPDAQLSPSSKIPPSMIGKIPGKRNANGTWGGFDWRRYTTTLDDVKQWATKDGASFGLRADRFPGVDIDCTDNDLSTTIAEFVRSKLGPAPARVGREPKQLLMYRTDAGFGRMRLWIKTTGGEHLVEILGVGQQYLVHGLHPATRLSYRWLQDPPAAADLTLVTREQANAMLDELAAKLDDLGLAVCHREADGRSRERTAMSQESLLAPSIDELREAVSLIPNSDLVFPDRTSYLKMGYAIRAAAGDDNNDSKGFEIFGEWASRWDGGTNDPDVVLADWRRMTGAKSVGWNWIAEQARGCGYNDAANDFEVLEGFVAEPESVAPQYSDQGLAASTIDRHGDTIKFVPETGRWFVWDESRWQEDTSLRAEDIIKRALRDTASHLMMQGVTPKEIASNEKLARGICSANRLKAVSQLIKSDRAVVVSVDSLDSDPWLLNTTAGIVDLRTGAITPPRADALMTKATTVQPDFFAECPEWKRFLAEATGGDVDLEAYLQRLAGYALTGSTREQHLSFLFGPGGNGKSVFLNALTGIMGDYACTAPMDAFTASNGDRHSTEIAMFVGKRLVIASETQAGRSWDEARVKSLTGGEPVTARFMRQDHFTYKPSFKLIFAGNHKPNIRDVDPAMKRRFQMVPFTRTPAHIDQDLSEKLRAEWPAILAWMIAGSLAWQNGGLNPPAAVQAMTAEYINDQDSVTAWLQECCEPIPDAFATIHDLFASWRMRCSTLGEPAGSVRRLGQALANFGFERGNDSRSRRSGFKGLQLRPIDMAEGLELVATV